MFVPGDWRYRVLVFRCRGRVLMSWEGDHVVGGCFRPGRALLRAEGVTVPGGWKGYAGRGDRVLRLVKRPSGDIFTLQRRKYPPKADPSSGGKLAFGDGEAEGAESMRLSLYIVLIPFARRARLSWEGDLFRDSVFAVGGRFCLGRVEWLCVWRKVLVDSGESTLRRQIDPPAMRLPSGDEIERLWWRGSKISSPLMREPCRMH